MRSFLPFAAVATFFLLLMAAFGFRPAGQQTGPQGAWQLNSGGHTQVLLFQDGYFTHTTYDRAGKRFIHTRGGTYQVQDGRISVKQEFDTEDKERVSQTFSYTYNLDAQTMTADIGGSRQAWQRLDEGKDNLAGVWKITARRQEGQLVPIHQTGPRKTLKILTGTRFQWAAINPETKEFSGTGGGTYTFRDGKYTEQIEFFSRDNNRVGAALTFDGRLQNGDWHHSGLSSRGDSIYEVWSKVKP